MDILTSPSAVPKEEGKAENKLLGNAQPDLESRDQNSDLDINGLGEGEEEGEGVSFKAASAAAAAAAVAAEERMRNLAGADGVAQGGSQDDYSFKDDTLNTEGVHVDGTNRMARRSQHGPPAFKASSMMMKVYSKRRGEERLAKRQPNWAREERGKVDKGKTLKDGVGAANLRDGDSHFSFEPVLTQAEFKNMQLKNANAPPPTAFMNSTGYHYYSGSDSQSVISDNVHGVHIPQVQGRERVRGRSLMEDRSSMVPRPPSTSKPVDKGPRGDVKVTSSVKHSTLDLVNGKSVGDNAPTVDPGGSLSWGQQGLSWNGIPEFGEEDLDAGQGVALQNEFSAAKARNYVDSGVAKGNPPVKGHPTSIPWDPLPRPQLVDLGATTTNVGPGDGFEMGGEYDYECDIPRSTPPPPGAPPSVVTVNSRVEGPKGLGDTQEGFVAARSQQRANSLGQ